MKTKNTTAAVAVLLAAVMLSGCGSNSEKTVETTEEAGFTLEVTAETSAEMSAVDTEEAAQTREEADLSVSSGEESESVSSGGQAFFEGQQTENTIAEQPVEFTAEDIETMRGFFISPQNSFRKIIFPDSEFDYSKEVTDLNQFLRMTYSWQSLVYQDMAADAQYSEFSELAGADVSYDLFKAETVESAIRERLLPDFDISKYELNKDTVYWKEDRQMFASINSFLPEGYLGNIYEIVNEGQEGDHYCITVIHFDPDLFPAGKAEGLKNLTHQKYTFRKLPNGNIAPLKMEPGQPVSWESKAADTVKKLLDINAADDESKLYRVDKYYAEDIDKDGSPDLIAVGEYVNNIPSEMVRIYSGFDIDNVKEYNGKPVMSEATGEMWVFNSYIYDSVGHSEYYNPATGESFTAEISYGFNDTETKYFTHNGAESTEKEFRTFTKEMGLRNEIEYEFKYDLNDYLKSRNYIDPRTLFDMMLFCRDNLI